MAELQVEAKYKTKMGQAVFTVMCSLFPLWALIAPAMLGYILGSTYLHPYGFTEVTEKLATRDVSEAVR